MSGAAYTKSRCHNRHAVSVYELLALLADRSYQPNAAVAWISWCESLEPFSPPLSCGSVFARADLGRSSPLFFELTGQSICIGLAVQDTANASYGKACVKSKNDFRACQSLFSPRPVLDRTIDHVAQVKGRIESTCPWLVVRRHVLRGQFRREQVQHWLHESSLIRAPCWRARAAWARFRDRASL
jgi:hypothetical protein